MATINKGKAKKLTKWGNHTNFPTLDLHGVKHPDVDRLVENFVLLNSEKCPIKVITGKSTKMNNLALAVIQRHKFGWHYNTLYEYGAIIVRGYEPEHYEKRINKRTN